MENGTPGGAKKHPKTRIPGRKLKISSFRLLPWDAACFRDRLAAAVSLVSDMYPIDSVGKFGGGCVCGAFWKFGNRKASKLLKTRIPGRKITFLVSVCFRGLPSASAGFRLLPRPLGRGGFVSCGIVSDRRCW